MRMCHAVPSSPLQRPGHSSRGSRADLQRPPRTFATCPRSKEGQEMLKIYAKGVEAMKNLTAGDPTGWLFQWYTHFVNGSTTKAAEISRIYPTAIFGSHTRRGGLGYLPGT